MKKVQFIGKSLAMVFLFILFVANVSAQDKKKAEEVKIKTSGHCDMCETKITKAIKAEKGVDKVSFDEKTKVVTVKYQADKTDAQKIRLAITKVGYDADNQKADKKAYEALPACCKN